MCSSSTNPRTISTLELLECQLASYSGTVLAISHDRTFLNNAVTSVWAFEKHPAEPAGKWLSDDDGWYVNEYVGGYDEWEERRLLPALPPGPALKKPTVADATPAPSARKLTYKEKKEHESLPARIEAMETEQTQWHVRLGDPAFYHNDGTEIAKAKKRVDELATEIETAYRRWEELESRHVGSS
jgi:ATP-binding cassette subfamily F protein uup